MRRRASIDALRRGRGVEVGLLVGVVVGVAVSTFHWSGLVLGGAIVGIVAPSLRRALLHGLYLGVAVLLAFAGALLLAGSLGKFLAMGQLFWASLAIGMGVPPVAALAARGLAA